MLKKRITLTVPTSTILALQNEIEKLGLPRNYLSIRANEWIDQLAQELFKKRMAQRTLNLEE